MFESIPLQNFYIYSNRSFFSPYTLQQKHFKLLAPSTTIPVKYDLIRTQKKNVTTAHKIDRKIGFNFLRASPMARHDLIPGRVSPL